MGDADYNRVVWQCRRGTRELDKLVSFYLENHYCRANEEQRRAFCRLLEFPDPVLYDHITGYCQASDAALSQVAKIIREGFAQASRDVGK